MGAAGLGHGDVQQMGKLLTQAVPAVPPQHITIAAGPNLPGRVTSRRWLAGGPPDGLLGPSPTTPPAGPDTTPAACQHSGRPLPADRPRRGRPAKYCSGACRTATHPRTTGHRRHPPRIPARRNATKNVTKLWSLPGCISWTKSLLGDC
jgi:hypothetical protein